MSSTGRPRPGWEDAQSVWMDVGQDAPPAPKRVPPRRGVSRGRKPARRAPSRRPLDPMWWMVLGIVLGAVAVSVGATLGIHLHVQAERAAPQPAVTITVTPPAPKPPSGSPSPSPSRR